MIRIKRWTRAVSLILSIILLCALFSGGVSVYAEAEGDSLTEAIDAVMAVDREGMTDAQYAGAMFSILSLRISEHYNRKDAPASVQTAVGEVISSYNLQKIYPVMIAPSSATQRNEATQTRVRDDALRALYAGSLAWIYYSTEGEAHGETVLSGGVTLSEYYSYLSREVVGGKAEGYFADGSTDEIYRSFGGLLQGVYEAKLAALTAESGLSSAYGQNFQAVLSRALFDIRACGYQPGTDVATPSGTVRVDGEDGSAFAHIYDRTVVAAELCRVMERLYPDRTLDSLAATESLVAELSLAGDPLRVNELIGGALTDLLLGLGGSDTVGNRYVYAYAASLRGEVEAVFDNADREMIIAAPHEVGDVFSDYSLQMGRAMAKDRLDARLDSLWANAVRYPTESAERNRASHLIALATLAIDGCDRLDAVALEEARGMSRLDLYDEYLFSCEEIRGYLSAADSFLSEAEARYTAASNRLAGAGDCDAVAEALDDGLAALSDAVAEAEAEAYRQRHADILSKIVYREGRLVTDALRAEDLDALRAAVADTASDVMSEAARGKLSQCLLGVGEAYRYVAALTASERMENEALDDPEDPLYELNQEAVDRVTDGILGETVDPDDLPALRESVEERLEEAEAIRDVIHHVTSDVREAEQYEQYGDEYVEEIESICREAIEEILNPDRVETPESLRDEAILNTERQEALAEIGIAASGREEIPGVSDAVEDAADRILHEAEHEAELREIVGEVTHEIDRLETVEEIRNAAEEVIGQIEELPYLNEEERGAWIDAVEASRDGQIAATEGASDAEALDEIEEAARNDMEEILADATVNDLENGREEAAGAVSDRVNEIEEIIGGYEYTDAEEREALLEDLRQAEEEALGSLAGCPDTDTLEETVRDLMDSLDSFEAEADRLETENCRDQMREDLSDMTGSDEEYAEERLEEIRDILESAEERLNGAESIEEMLEIRAETEAALEAVPDRLDDAQALAGERLQEAYGELMDNRVGYSESGLAEIEGIYQETILEIQGYTEISQVAQVLALTEERISMMRDVLLNKIFTEDRLLATGSASGGSYDPWAKGYFGSLSATMGVGIGTKLHIYDLLLDGVAEKIMAAAKANRMVDQNGVLLSKELNRLFRNCYVTRGFDITLVEGSVVEGGTYGLSILLPDGTFLDHAIGIVFLRDDGSAEYYEFTRDGMTVSFSTEHFSEYYLVSANTVNLIPLIVLMALIIAGEVVILARLYIRRSRRRDGMVVLPGAALFNPYRPEGAWSAITLMGVVILLLAGWILVLLLGDYLAKRRRIAPAALALLPADGPSMEYLPEPEPEVEELPEEEPETDVEEDGPITMVTSEMESLFDGYSDPESYTGVRRGEINLDTLSDHFTSGETVTLNSLKALKLVPEQVGAVKVLARGRLDAPMTIVAQGFSQSARMAILEAGGEVIVTLPSEERRERAAKREHSCV